MQFEESDAREHYVEFFEDALPELEKAGKVVQFKVHHFDALFLTVI